MDRVPPNPRSDACLEAALAVRRRLTAVSNVMFSLFFQDVTSEFLVVHPMDDLSKVPGDFALCAAVLRKLALPSANSRLLASAWKLIKALCEHFLEDQFR